MDEKHILLLDSSVGDDSVDIQIIDSHGVYKHRTVSVGSGDSQRLLGRVLRLCMDVQISPYHVSAIVVVYGAERFTTVRLVTVIANALAWSCGVPVLGYPTMPTTQVLWQSVSSRGVQGSMVTSFIEPTYTKEPTVTITS